MDAFSHEEAQRWIGRTVIAKTAFEADHIQIGAEEQGTVIGVDEQSHPAGDPIIRLVVEFQRHGAAPTVIRVPKGQFIKYLCPSHTVETPRAAR